MKQLIPFKKDIIFKTKLSEIVSISLEHTLKLVDSDTISGEFVISGEYKITDYSVNKEDFRYSIPFDIALNNKYSLTDSVVDIDDFYYEIINDDVLRINIDVMIDGIEEIIVEEKLEESIKEKSIEIEQKLEEDRHFNNSDQDSFVEEKLNMREEKTMIGADELFKTDAAKETFTTYKVYIVRESDTIETIVTKYNISKDELSLYNDINNIVLGEKIIIPYINNG